MTVMYSTRVRVEGGRDGHAKSDDGVLDVELAMPGAEQPGSNPEQLFAAGYAACFASTAMMVARMMGHKLEDIPVTAEVSLNQENHSYSLGVRLVVEVPLHQSEAEKLVAEADERCPYAKATRNNVAVEFDIRGR